jgi:hypothetical protein
MNRVLTMRKAGVPFEVIADRVGYKDKSGAYRAWERAMKGLVTEPAEELRKLELARLDDLLFAIWKKGTEGDLGAIDKLLKISERRAKLAGLDMPTMLKNELTGPGGGPIQVSEEEYDLDLLTVEEVVQLQALLTKARKRKADDGGE